MVKGWIGRCRLRLQCNWNYCKYTTDNQDIDVELTGVERIDIREYVDIAQPRADGAQLYL